MASIVSVVVIVKQDCAEVGLFQNVSTPLPHVRAPKAREWSRCSCSRMPSRSFAPQTQCQPPSIRPHRSRSSRSSVSRILSMPSELMQEFRGCAEVSDTSKWNARHCNQDRRARERCWRTQVSYISVTSSSTFSSILELWLIHYRILWRNPLTANAFAWSVVFWWSALSRKSYQPSRRTWMAWVLLIGMIAFPDLSF